jgi:RNA polymerase sigma-70 factor (ECF subfamily)
MQPESVKTPAKALSDLEIAQRIAAGDRDVLERLMRQNNQRLYRTARSILKDDAEAEDAVQEAYLLAYQAMAGFRGGSSLSTWLVRIVVNEAIARVRKRGRRAEVIQLEGTTDPEGDHREEDTLASSTEQPEEAVLRAETRRMIEAKIDQLPDVFRTVFVLRAVEELTVEEAAACLGIPAATVRTRYFRAKGLLREAIARDVDVSMEEAFAFAGDRCDRIVAGVLERLNHLSSPDSGPGASST